MDNHTSTVDNHTSAVDNRNSTVDNHDSTLETITFVGIILSITCLVLHLVIFAATPQLRNLPAMNLASLCVALLLLYTSFIASAFLESPCVELDVTIHYSLMATFCWMVVISFDVWRAIRRSTRDLQLSSGEKIIAHCGRVGRVKVLNVFLREHTSEKSSNLPFNTGGIL
jgi:hypothetical protein